MELKQKIKKVYIKSFPNYTSYLKKLFKDCHSILDVGCGSDSPIKYVKNRPQSTGVDIFQPSIEISKKNNIHNNYIKCNLLELDKKFEDSSYDCVIASDIIEHFKKEEGDLFLKKIEKIARKKVIIFTPNGFVSQGKFKNNPWQIHQSGWTGKEMIKKGYKVVGIGGWKKLKGNFAQIKYKPKILWRIFSDITQKITKQYHSYAFSILCVKNLK